MSTTKNQPQKPGRMSGRERVLAALNGQPVDRIPFTPLFDPYTLLGLPEELTGDTSINIYHPRRQIAALKALGCDLLIRGVATTVAFSASAPQLQGLGAFAPPVEAKTELKDDELREILTTPVGTLTGIWKFTDRVGTIPHFIKYVVNNHEEMEVFHYAVEHFSTEPPQPRYDKFLKIDELLGDEGLPTASMFNSPLMHLIEFVFGLENTYILLNDYRNEFEDILEKMHAAQRRHVEALAASPAPVVIQYENTSSTLLSPKIFRRYCLPYLNNYADILRAAGKIFLIHMCGKLHAMVDDINQGHFNGICDIAPLPTGDLPLDEAAARLPGKVVIGGIDATTYICQDAEFVKMEVSSLIERIKPFNGVLLGSGDVTPRGASVENFRIIRSLVDTLGTYT